MYIKFNGNTIKVEQVDPIERSFTKQEFTRVFVLRSKVDESDFERGQTEILLVENTSDTAADARFGGILKDVNRKESLTEIVIESFERYAKDAIPTRGGERWENVSSDTIVQDAIDDVPQLSAGTLGSVGGNISLVFSHTSPARKIRKTAEAVGAEVVYNADKTVDFLSQRGGSVGEVISPSNQNIKGDFRANKISGAEDITHLRVVGAGEGVHQQEVNFIPDDDSNTYPNLDNVNRYNASHWSSGDRKEWRTKSAKQQTEVAALTQLGQKVVDDVQTTDIEVNTTLDGLDVTFGDRLSVNYPEEELDGSRLFRVVELKKKITNKGIFDDVTLSTRPKLYTESDRADDTQDLDNYNLAFEGSPVTITTGGGRQPVTSSLDYQFSFYYPDEVRYEHRVKLLVKGFAYRAYSSGSEAGGDHNHSFTYVKTGRHSHDYNTNGNLEHSHEYNTNGNLEHSHTYNTNGNLEHGHTYNTNGNLEHSHTYNTNGNLEHSHTYNKNGNLEHGHTYNSSNELEHGHTYNSSNELEHDHALNDSDQLQHDHDLDHTADSGAGDVEYSGVENQAFFGPTNETYYLDIPDFGGDDPAYAVAYVNVYRADDSGNASVEVDMFQNYGQGNTIFNGGSRTYDPKETRTFQGAEVDPQAGTDHWEFNFDATGDASTFRVQFGLWAVSKHDHAIQNVQTADGLEGAATSDTELGAQETTDTELGSQETTDTELGTQQTTDTELGSQQTTDTELGSQQTTDTELGSQETTDTELGSQQTTNTELGSQQTTDVEAETTEGITTTEDTTHTHPIQPGIIEDFSENQTFNYEDRDSWPVDVDVSTELTVNVVALGAGSSEGNGGFIDADIDVSNINTLQVYPGDHGDGGVNGKEGYYNGGDGGCDAALDNSNCAEGGAGSTTVLDGNGNELLHAGGAGGKGANYFDGGTEYKLAGGGAGVGGAGGSASGGDVNVDGNDAEGTGSSGGDGADADSNLNVGDGDGVAVDPRVSVNSTVEAGGNGSVGGAITLEFRNERYPNNCDVIVNGTPIGVSLGDGTSEFEEQVDLAGELTPGQVNTIEISSDSLGHIQSHVDIDVYRQILGDG